MIVVSNFEFEDPLFEDPWVPNGGHAHHRPRQDREGGVRPGDRFLLGISNGGYPGSDTGNRGQNSRKKGQEPFQGGVKSDPQGNFQEVESEKIQATTFMFQVFGTRWLHAMNLFFVQYRAANLKLRDCSQSIP